METNIPLAKHDIKKGQKIAKEDVCYVDDETGDFKEFFYGGITISPMDPYSHIIGMYVIQDIVKYETINETMLEDERTKNLREAEYEIKQELKRKQKVTNVNQIDDDIKKQIENNIWL